MYKFFFILILLLAFFFRFFGVNWDEGSHLHPDERMIIMVADRIHLPKSPEEWQTVFTPQSPLNPKFFAYGSFPIYLLKMAGWLFGSDDYDGRLAIGRSLSVVFDIGTVILVYLIARTIIESGTKNKDSYFPLLASFFYAVSALPIQSSHFFISDMPLTFLTTWVLYLSLRLITNYQLPITNLVLLGLSLGLALATKITAILLVIPILTALLIYFFRTRKIKSLFFSSLVILLFAVIAFVAAMPYGIIDLATFKAHTLEQSRMRVDPFVFPFTLQYVDTTPYWYFIRNIILWGMGLPLGIAAITGTIYVIVFWLYQFIKKFKFHSVFRLKRLKKAGDTSEGSQVEFLLASDEEVVDKTNLLSRAFRNETWDTRVAGPVRWDKLSILIIFFAIYFLFMGKSAVKFMRYMLPLYPLLCTFGSLFICQLIERLKLKKVSIILIICFIMLLWPIAFTSIYARTHTRIAASLWIYENIPNGAKLGIEHWDDSLPLMMSGQSKSFTFVDFPLYERDTPQKWEMMKEKLRTVDYIVIASNRLYVPLIRLADCEKFPVGRCYPMTADYYKNLFAGNLGFTKVAEFTSYPSLSFPLITQLLNYSITFNDDSADESFTVYDHPKIMIFKKSL